ncbi:methylenetetrahydrofolate reductase [NAD(P)H] [Aeoliella sp. ICT_H6.2]|uniref:Methylenetetrahydrofolate reductase n=1 Tax=Aeoliella straminimaris TaxID=2954799 RepID=A0A9X2FEG3_9BACT|nr:methylenetetrahydrofolate reductase [NAD(P)H] [Aeoliella straminimaris]MCO6046698.1 methylenetetrahydrofolate reductase [NAD(P)H] [Aeoliella straminimaris]
MSLADYYLADHLGLSFELFPPKTPAGERALFRHVERLVEFNPAYITCTYGAGGSTQNKTLDIVARVRETSGLPVATHLTCVNRTADQLAEYLSEARARGVDNVVALRGDPPKGESTFTATQGGFRYANELVEFIRERFADMGVAVAGYPEKHVEAPSLDIDLENLRRKVDAGADVVITQLFYDNADFFAFRDHCTALGITVPIVPGLLPVTNFAQIQRITSLCGAKLPEDFVSALQSAGEDEAAQFDVGVEFATRQLEDLIKADVPGIHLYVLNKSEAASRVLENLGLGVK